MGNILEEIVAAKRVELQANRAGLPEPELETRALDVAPRRGFLEAVTPSPRGRDIRLIAEIKKASPSKGLIRPDFRPVEIARAYEDGGAAAISVLTDGPFFQGSLDILRSVARAASLPLLRKDFVLERYQLLEAREAGASAVLLIVAILTDAALRALLDETRRLEMDALVEVHNEEELARALATDARIIGLNNRDLTTFNVDLGASLRLCPLIPQDRITVSESGVFTHGDAMRLRDAGIDAMLVGESLMRSPDPADAVRELLCGA